MVTLGKKDKIMNVNMNISENDRRYRNVLQNNINNRAVSQISFAGGNPLRNAIASKNTKQTAENLKLFLIRTFCKPSEYTIDCYCDNLQNMFWQYNKLDVNDKVITKIFSILDIHSKNQGYSDFVKEGIGFLKKIKDLEKNVEPKHRKFYTGAASEPSHGHTIVVAGEEGSKLFDTITFALKKAIRPNSDVVDHYSSSLYLEDSRLQEYIRDSRKYMAEFKS